MRIDGQIELGEGSRWVVKACARLNARPWVLGMALAGGLIAAGLGGLAAYIAVEGFDAPGWLFAPVMVGVVWTVGLGLVRILNRFAMGQYRRRLAARGVTGPLVWRFETDEVGFRREIGGIETRVKWAVVSEIYPVGPYWVVLAQGAPIFVPKRHLAGGDQERVFIAEVLSHLTPEGRGRSAAAVKFAEPPAA